MAEQYTAQNQYPTDTRRRTARQALEHVEEALRGLRHGEVTVVVQDGVAVQVKRTVKMRLSRETEEP